MLCSAVAGTLAVAAAALGRRRRSESPDATSRENKHGKRERERRRGEIVCAGCQAEVTLLACERQAAQASTHYLRRRIVVVTSPCDNSLIPSLITRAHALSLFNITARY